MNLLIELYDYPCGEDFYYIQNNEVKEFSDEIVKKLSNISVEILIGGLFFGSESEIKKRKGRKNFRNHRLPKKRWLFNRKDIHHERWNSIKVIYGQK